MMTTRPPYPDRNLALRPYTADEMRVGAYISECTNGAVGYGEDPIGFLIASHSYINALYKELTVRMDAVAKQTAEDACTINALRGKRRKGAL